MKHDDGTGGLSGRLKRLFRSFMSSDEKHPAEESSADDSTDIVEEQIVTDRLDLHGFFPEQIPEVMEEFLMNARKLGIKEVRIIHGKGKSVLRREVLRFLEDDLHVVEHGQAPPERGGWGATVAILRIPDDEGDE